MIRVSFLQFFKEPVHSIFEFLILLSYFHGIEHCKECVEVLFLWRGFIVYIAYKSRIQKKLSFYLFPDISCLDHCLDVITRLAE